MVQHRLDAVLFDLGGTLIVENDGSVPVGELVAQPFPSAVEDLAELANLTRIGVVTNTTVMSGEVVRSLLEPTGLNQHIELLISSFDVGVHKPNPKPLQVAMQQMGLADPARVLYVGDRETDREAASAASMPYVHVTNGRAVDAVIEWVQAEAGSHFNEAMRAVGRLDSASVSAAHNRQLMLTKPPGSLGRLEEIAAQVCGIAGDCPATVPSSVAVAVFCGDHGVLDEGISPWPQDVSCAMATNIANGGAAISALARTVGAKVLVVDVGLANRAGGAVVDRNVGRATQNLAKLPAMTTTQLYQALDVGVRVAQQLVDEGAHLLVTGEMGIGNTTASAATIARLSSTDAAAIVGRGTGIDDTQYARKVELVVDAVARSQHLGTPDAIAALGGFEIAALAGFIVGGASRRVPVIIDGVIALAALMIADAIAEGVREFCIAGHLSTEPAAEVALKHLNLVPVFDLQMRLGEGSGAVLAVPIIQAACAALADMATLADLGFGPPN